MKPLAPFVYQMSPRNWLEAGPDRGVVADGPGVIDNRACLAEYPVP